MILKELFGTEPTQKTSGTLTAKERLEIRKAERETKLKKQKEAFKKNASNSQKQVDDGGED